MAETSPPHLVLARKWRPDRFTELVGQEHVTRTLSEALKRGRIAHAFLFTGIRGVGKTTAARILARCLNCERGPTPEPCGECVACREIRAGSALDVSEIDGATYRKIDDARSIIENLSYRPARDRFKIYIIDEAHQLTDQAFNALLKTLEEPPAHVKFILATTEPQKMPETILSRLQRYDFRRIPFTTICERLHELAEREETRAEPSALRLLAREAGGSMRDAERMLETAIATASDGQVTEAEVAASLGVASRGTVLKIIEAILGHSAAPALRMTRELAARGANLESLGRDLLETLRNLAVAKLPADAGQTPLDELPDHEAQELRRIAASASSRDLMRLFRLMAEAQEEIISSPYPDLLIEMAVVRMASLAPVMDADELLRAIGAAGSAPARGPGSPSSGGGEGSRSAQGEAPAGARRLPVKGEVKADAPLLAPVPAPSSGPAAAVASDLPAFRDHIRSRRAALAGFMEQGALLAFENNTLKVFPRNDIYIRYLADNRQVIGDLAAEFFECAVKVELAGPGALPHEVEVSAPSPQSDDPSIDAPAASAQVPPTRTGSSSADERAEIYSDPGMRRIFDAFEARLVEVRPSRGSKEQGN
ncbi:MAG TPA: DNA polymerase III subunit gamma/tau [Candidatus Binataceae bacterium]